MDICDFINFLADDPHTQAVACILEGVRDGPRFMAAALHAARRGKPIVAIKVGKSEYGIKAAASHTAAIAGSAEINSAVFRELGIVEVDDIDEAVDVATLLARRQPIEDLVVTGTTHYHIVRLLRTLPQVALYVVLKRDSAKSLKREAF